MTCYKMTGKDAGKFLQTTERRLAKLFDVKKIPYNNFQSKFYFGHTSAKKLFGFNFKSKVVQFHIVKGGTGKTSIAHEFSVRASLYGAKVLCIDLDQQGNLTHCFNKDVENVPVMVDVLVDGYDIKDAIIEVSDGIDLIGSRIENALLDEAIRLKKYNLSQIYKNKLKALRKKYDLIVIDCPPNLGQSVAAMALASDLIISPVTPEKFAQEGLLSTAKVISELESKYKTKIPFNILLNKFEARKTLSKETLNYLDNTPGLKKKLLETRVRFSPDYPNAVINAESIFNTLKVSTAKTDIDSLVLEVLNLDYKSAKKYQSFLKKKSLLEL